MKGSSRRSHDRPPEGGGRNPTVEFKGEKRSNETHYSQTDADARLYRKSKGDKSQLCYMGHALMESRNGLAVDAEAAHTTKKASAMLVADKGYDVAEFVAALRGREIPSHSLSSSTQARSAGSKAARSSGGGEPDLSL